MNVAVEKDIAKVGVQNGSEWDVLIVGAGFAGLYICISANSGATDSSF